MPRTADLVTEIHRLASKRGWTQAELARQLGVNRSVLVHARGGRRWFTNEVIARIARVFADVPTIRDLVWNYLRYDFPVGTEERGVLPLRQKQATGLPGAATEAIRRYVRSFPMRLVDGHGLVVTGSSARMLSLAAKEVEGSLSASGVRVHRRAAVGSLGPSETGAIGRCRLLILERLDGGKEAASRLLAELLASERPVVVTSAAPIETILGEQLARLLLSRTTLLSLDGPSCASRG